MKRLFLCIILMMSLSEFSTAEDINECKTDIYFGNGVWNEYEDATDSKDELESLIINETIKNNPLLQSKYGKVKLAYNWGQGAMLDVLEVYYQLREARQLDGIEFYAALYLLSAHQPHITLSAVATQALMEPLTKDWEEGNVDEMLRKYYDESFKLGHRVLLVSHSQGNMFANRIYDTIDPVGYQNYFANLQVASPASEVKALKGDYVTLYGDPIINPIPSSMAGNANGNPGHAFVGAYLDQEDPYNKIASKLKQLLETLDSEGSQWETNQESNKNACDYKITVKHRFDPAVEMPLDVYPFAPSKYLYQVNGEYVKASCGGQNILDTWDAKQANECLMIDNPQKEKIEEACKEPSLFEIVSHANINTKDWRITVKNKKTNETFDNVYPFNHNGSLYQLGSGEWVLASCGGKTIAESWEGQKSNEYFVIDNPEEEKIVRRNNKIKYNIAVAVLTVEGTCNSGTPADGYIELFDYTTNGVEYIEIWKWAPSGQINEFESIGYMRSFTVPTENYDTCFGDLVAAVVGTFSQKPYIYNNEFERALNFIKNLHPLAIMQVDVPNLNIHCMVTGKYENGYRCSYPRYPTKIPVDVYY